MSILFISILFQIIRYYDSPPKFHILILMEVLALSFLIRLLFISPDNLLAGNDAYNELVTLGTFINDGITNGSRTFYYPPLYSFAELWGKILGTGLLDTAKWFPISFFFISPLLLYSIGARKYSPGAGLIAATLFSFTYITMLFHSWLHRETLAVPLMILSLYFYFRTLDGEPKRVMFISLTIIFSALCIMTHHLTSLILLVFFLSVFISDALTPLWNSILERIKNQKYIVIEEKTGITFFLLIMVIVLGHWMLQDRGPLEYFFTLAMNESVTREPGATFIFTTLRLKFLVWGEIIFALIFATLSIAAVVALKQVRRTSDIGLFIFSAILSIIMIITLFGLLFPTEGMGLGSRFQTFVYLGLFILSAPFIIRLVGHKKRVIQSFIIVLLLTFLLMNFLRVPLYLYDNNHTIESDETRIFISPEEASAAQFLGLGRGEVSTDLPLGGYFQYVVYLDTGFGVRDNGYYSVASSNNPTMHDMSITDRNLFLYSNGNCIIYFSSVL